MKSTLKTKKYLPSLKSEKNNLLFGLINFYLVIDVISLFTTLFFLFMNLDSIDSILIYSMTGLVGFICSTNFYLIGYQMIVSDQTEYKHHPNYDE